LPLVALRNLYPPLVSDGLAGVVVSALFAGVSVYLLSDILRSFGMPAGWRIAICIVFALNPMIVFYGTGGMSDLMMVGALLGALNGVLWYIREGNLRRLTSGAIWLAVGFGIRYEAVPVGMLMAIGLVVGLHRQGRTVQVLRGTTVLLLAPLVYAVGVWMYANWLIMKNPLYFLTSLYGNASQLTTGVYDQALPMLSTLPHHLVLSVEFVSRFAELYWPFVPGLAVVLLLLAVQRFRDTQALVTMGAALGAPLLEVGLIYLGKSAGWARFFIYYIPFGVVLAALAATKLSHGRRGWLVMLATVLVLVAGDVSTYRTERYSNVLGHGDGLFYRDIAAGKPYPFLQTQGIDPSLERYLDAHPHLTVLLDTFGGYPLVLQTVNLKRYVITSDLDFESILQNPKGRVDAILVPVPTGLGTVDAVNRQWPGLWSGHVKWARLIASFGGGTQYRLYAVQDNAP